MNITHKKAIEIITPVYNAGDLLLQTYRSIQAQTFGEFSWIVVNDFSNDRQTLEIMRELAERDGRVILIHHTENKGLSAARNTGIQSATGRYLFFLDADDLIDPGFLEKAYLFLEMNQEFAFANSYVKGFGAIEYAWKGGFHEKAIFLEENRNTSCFMARREVFDALLFDETMRDGCEDWDFWLHAASKGLWGYTIPEYLFHYRRSNESKWSALQGKKQLGSIRTKLTKRYASLLRQKGFPNPQVTRYSFGYKNPVITIEKNVGSQPAKHIVCLFPWLEIGGADQFNFQLLKGLKEKGWHITIITTNKSGHPLHEEFQRITKDIIHLANLGAENSFRPFIEYIIKTRRPYCMLLSNAMYGYYLLPWLKQQFPGMPIADFLHCEDPGWYNGGYPFFSAQYSGLLDKTYVTSEQLKQWCIERSADAEKIDVCYINIDTKLIRHRENKRKELRERLGLDPDLPLLLYVARLTHQKQPLVLVKVLAVLQQKGLAFKCVIIGDGPDRYTMLEQIEKSGLKDKVIYMGSQPNPVVLEFMDAADIFFLPSLYEGIALSIFEAMAKGLVIVGAATGGQAELVTAACGFLVKRDRNTEVQDYVSVIEKLIQHPGMVRKMGSTGRTRVEEHFDLEHMINQMDHSLSRLKPGQPARRRFEQAYLQVLDRMMYLEEHNNTLNQLTNSGLVRHYLKHEQSYKKVGMVYYKVKKLLKIKAGK